MTDCCVGVDCCMLGPNLRAKKGGDKMSECIAGSRFDGSLLDPKADTGRI